VVVGRTVYFGCEDGNLYALSTISGATRWATALGGPVKSAPAYYGGRLYVGDYGGYMNAVDAKSGKLIWQSGSLGPGFGASGQFYSTPAVAYGRVYSGNNDGRVYSFDEKTGALAWSHSTGSYVYSGGTVAQTPNSPPTVFIGSYDGDIYALDAKTGDTRWSHSIGPVIGSLSAVGNIVYVATFQGTTTYGFKMASGRQVFHFDTGAYMPVISDGRWIYLTGYSSITALKPYKPLTKKQKQQKRRAQKKKQKSNKQAGKAQAKKNPQAKPKAKPNAKAKPKTKAKAKHQHGRQQQH
jgi:outer membrane protein assembly factor BamB